MNQEVPSFKASSGSLVATMYPYGKVTQALADAHRISEILTAVIIVHFTLYSIYQVISTSMM